MITGPKCGANKSDGAQVKFNDVRAISSISVWNADSTAPQQPLPFAPGSVGVAIGNTASITGCAVLPAAPGATAPPGFSAFALVCGATGGIARLSFPGAAGGGGPLVVKFCTVPGAEAPSSASLWVRAG